MCTSMLIFFCFHWTIWNHIKKSTVVVGLFHYLDFFSENHLFALHLCKCLMSKKYQPKKGNCVESRQSDPPMNLLHNKERARIVRAKQVRFYGTNVPLLLKKWMAEIANDCRHRSTGKGQTHCYSLKYTTIWKAFGSNGEWDSDGI